jgi:hypothetical protein
MALQDITLLIQRVAVDRATKLQILSILSANADPRVADDIEQLLRSYEEMDMKENAALMARLGAIDATYQNGVRKVDEGLQRDVRVMLDDIDRNDEIDRIRQTLT